MNYFDIENEYELHSLQDIGDDDHAVIVLEDIETRKLSFFRIEFKDISMNSRCLNLIRIGLLNDEVKNADASPITKTRAKVFKDGKG